MSLSGKAKKAQIQEAREKERQRAAEEQAKEKAAAARAEREREQRAREAMQGGPVSATATPAANASSARPSAAAASVAPRSAAPPLLDDDDEFGGIIPVRRIIRGAAPAAQAAASGASSASVSSAASAASAPSSISSVAPAAASLPSVVPMLGSSSAAPTANKLRTAFARESDEAIAARKAASRLPLVRRPDIFDAAGTGGSPSTDYYSAAAGQISIPLRPEWKGKTAAQVESQEQDYFHRWLEEIYTRFPAERLNHFEHNLEVWRQLWRVCERSDILLVIVDARVPLLNFPPSLYRFITGTLRKPLVMVLNKIDLIPAGVVNDWIRFFRERYPSMHVVPFTSFPEERQESLDALVKSKAKRGKGRTLFKPFGAEQLLDACRKIVASQGVSVPDAVKQSFSFEPTLLQGGSQSVEKNEQIYAGADDYMRAGSSGDGDDDDDDLGSSSLSQELAQLGVLKSAKRDRALKRKQLAEINARHLSDLQTHSIAEEPAEEIDEDDAADAQDVAVNSAKYSGALGLLEEEDEAQQRNSSFITLGCLGMPNAGKSSLINALAGRKLVSVSKTPGHTKYLQTLFLNPATRLCDCPGLVFPAVDMPRALQVISGSFPIAQTREPFSAVQFLAERIPLETIYKLTPPAEAVSPNTISSNSSSSDESKREFEWSAWLICESVANKKGFFNRQGAPDAYRAANFILREVLDGVVTFFFVPPK